MSNIWFTSDYHLSHPNIIRFNNRPYGNIVDHDRETIAIHNKLIAKDDLVYFLGDLTLNRDPDIVTGFLSQLNGQIHFCLGNHDKAHISCYHKHCEWVGLMTELKIAEYRITMCHYELAVYNGSHFNNWLLFGHAHSKLAISSLGGKRHCVNIDFNNYRPLNLDEVIAIMKTKGDNWDVIGGPHLPDRWKHNPRLSSVH